MLGDLTIDERARNAALNTSLSLPGPVVRRLAGRPVRRDGQTLDPEAQLMLKLQKVAREPAVASLPLAEGRPVQDRQARAVGGVQPIGSVEALRVPGADGDLDARLYVPISTRMEREMAPSDRTAPPLVVFFHGGGHVWGSLDSHDPAARFLASRAGVRVLSVDYRLAPEAPFPAAVEDCFEAYVWAVNNAASLGVDPERLAVAGDSAGGHLAATTALKAAEQGLPMAFQLLVYPVTDFVTPTASREMFSEGFYLTSEYMDAAGAHFFPDAAMKSDPWASIIGADVPDGLAPAHVVTAGFDPLRDEGEAYAAHLREAGVDCTLKRYPGMIHGFFNAVGVGNAMPAATAEICGHLGRALR